MPRNPVLPIGSRLGEYLDTVERAHRNKSQPPLRGMPSGYELIDVFSNGLQGIVVLAGPVGSGKTSLLLNLAERASRSGDLNDRAIVISSYEHRSEENFHRLLCAAADVDSPSVRAATFSETELDRLRSTAAQIETRNVHYLDARGEQFRLPNVATRAVFVDAVHSSFFGDSPESFVNLAWQAEARGISVVMTIDNTDEKLPSHLMRAADLILLLEREPDAFEGDDLLAVTVAKNRSGVLGDFKLRMNANSGRVSDLFEARQPRETCDVA